MIRTVLQPLARRSGAHDKRSYERRMADALVDVAWHHLDNGLVPQSASQRTHLQVTTSLETLSASKALPRLSWSSRFPSPPRRRAAGLRLLGHPHPSRLGVDGHRRRARQAGDLGAAAQGAQRSRSAVACGRVVTGRRPGPQDITWCIGSAAAAAICRTSPCSAIGITGWCTRAAGRSCAAMTAA